MKKYLIAGIMTCLVAVSLFGQKTNFQIHNSDKGLYLEHKVVKGESFYAIGKKYNVSPAALASFNKLDINKGLKIDQKISIPLSENNFTQKGNSGTPVYYISGDNEKLSNISKKNGGVAVATLKQWNNLSSETVKKNEKLVIGFIKSNELPSVTIKPKPVQEVAEVAVTEEEVLSKKDKEAEKKEAEAEKKAEEKTEKIAEKKTEPVPQPIQQSVVVAGNGYFKNDFEKQVKVIPVTIEQTVTSGIFKTTSGWEDGKFYLLIDDVTPGTIVKITNPANNNAIYAKVLGEMAGIRQNEGYGIRISNAGASLLNVNDQEKFIVKINY